MNYQVLTRKWRPKTFSDVVGQEHVLTSLANGLSLGRIHHSYLFSGVRGIGKTSIARLLAKGLNCEKGITAMPCGVCNNCREIEQGCFVDLIEIDAASRAKVEDTRDLLDSIHYATARGRFKIYLIDEVHMLSRHSFNALLKALEEPPAHIKFLLATTDQQKLPVTILSRCLQFHLKVLNTEQIRNQLEYILNKENVVYEPRALQLITRAADGSLRDALSLTDQAIASGNGKITTESVSIMLGTIDDNQALSLIEAVIYANGDLALSIINSAAAYGIDWEALLIEILTLLHYLAMLQLSPSFIDADMTTVEHRLRKLASSVSPTDVQLYYQTFLIGRKELPFAPSRRMGVEMTLLRALAFHPCAPLPESKMLHRPFTSVESVVSVTTEKEVSQPSQKPDLSLSDATTSAVLVARSQLRRAQKSIKPKNNDTTSAMERSQLFHKLATIEQKSPSQGEAYHRKRKMSSLIEETKIEVDTSKVLMKELEHKKVSPELVVKIDEEVVMCDSWAAEINQLQLSKLVKQVALNAWKEQDGNRIRLHLRSNYRHLNSSSTQKELSEAITALQGFEVELTIVEDDNPEMCTPLERYRAIYDKKLNQAREAIISDSNIQKICRFFDADLDEKSIVPL